jgi:hypothetical protein
MAVDSKLEKTACWRSQRLGVTVSQLKKEGPAVECRSQAFCFHRSVWDRI